MELQRIWKSVNLERWRELQRVGAKNRRARKTGAEGRITRQDVTELLDLQGGFCAAEHCRASLGGRFHVDHIIPLSKNGTNKRDNVQLLCPSCNLSKNNKTMEEWMGLKRMLI